MPRKHEVNAAGQEMPPVASNRPAPTAATSSNTNVARKNPAAFAKGIHSARADGENGSASVIGLRTPDAVEDPWTRFASRRATILPLPGGEGRGLSRHSVPATADEGELSGHCFSRLLQIRGAMSGVLGLMAQFRQFRSGA